VLTFLRSLIWSRSSGLMHFVTADLNQRRVNVCKELREMQPSCLGSSLLTRAGFMVLALRQSNKLSYGKV
jgi:hypothetical protein